MLRPKFGAWRDSLVRAVDARLEARAEARQHKHLVTVEQKGLKASGLSESQAREKALASAAATMRKAAEQAERAAQSSRSAPRKPRPAKQVRYEDYTEGRSRSLLARIGALVGPQMRFMLGGALLLGCLAWLHRNGMLPTQKVQELAKQAAQRAAEIRSVDDLKKISMPGDLKMPTLPRDVDVDNLKGN